MVGGGGHKTVRMAIAKWAVPDMHARVDECKASQKQTRLEECTCNGDTLPLAARQKQAPVPHQCVIALRQGANEVMGIGCLCRLHHLIQGAPSIAAVADVVCNAACAAVPLRVALGFVRVPDARMREPCAKSTLPDAGKDCRPC